MLLRRALQGASLEPGNKHQNFTKSGKIFVFIAGKRKGKRRERNGEKRRKEERREKERIREKTKE
jgi:hypothetical protein